MPVPSRSGRARLPHLGTVMAAGGVAAILVMALVQRAIVAGATDHVLDWDETYYVSIAATAGAGLGLFPFVQGYPVMAAMGGIGHAMWTYVLAFEVFGSDVRSLRLVTFLAALVGLAGVWVLCRRWYGGTVASLTIAAVSSSTLFRMTNSARPDALVFAWAAWSVALAVAASGRPRAPAWHFAAGLLAGLGLQVHLHSLAVVAGIGLMYVVDALPLRVRDQPPVWRLPLFSWLAGYAGGALLFVLFNVWPDPDAFFRTAGLTRLAMLSDEAYQVVDATPGELLASFFAPAALLEREISRVGVLYASVARVEVWTWMLAVVVLFAPGKGRASTQQRALLLGTVIGAAVVLNGESPVYATHTLAVLLLPVAGLLGRLSFGPSEQSGRWQPVLLLAILAGLVGREALQWPRTAARVAELHEAATTSGAWRTLVDDVRSRASTGCHLAGDTGLYVPHFTDYPSFTGTRATEVRIGSSYARLSNDLAGYWRLKAPDVVFGDVPTALAAYVREDGYQLVADGVWVRTGRLSESCEVDLR